jgi:phosphatidylglycerophosphatase C
MTSLSDNNETIAVFDFDGTITSRDSLIDFLINSFGIYHFIKSLIMLSPILLMNKLKIISSNKAKERLFGYFTHGYQKDSFYDLCKTYSLGRLPQIIRTEALARITWHKKQNHRIVIVSASPENWILPWASSSGFDDVIATVPEINNGIMTGRFKTKNCKGKEKVRRFLDRYPHRSKYVLYVYGDSSGDKEILHIADKPFFKRFQ